MAGTGKYTLQSTNVRPTTAPQIVDYIIESALKLNASDIHLAVNQAPQSQQPYLLRYRIDGKLRHVRSDFLGALYKEAITRIKVLAGMDITDTLTPQDGKITIQTPQGDVNLRVNSVPGDAYEDIVIRVQRPAKQVFHLNNLFIADDLRSQLQDLIQQKSGMIILNGPTGSGKTTTIYSILGTLSGPEKKIITAEDPIEVHLPFISHTQVTPRTSFADLCRAFMRQDADVIFVGEVRDEASADAAVSLAQTGHLLLTTLHTRDSIGVISRLESFGIHPNMIATTLIGSLSQRLVPRLCNDCKVPYAPDQGVIRKISAVAPVPAGVTFYNPGKGCKKCVNGIAGRLPIFELFVVDPELGDMINRSAPKTEILAAARRKGMKTLADDALFRVYAGYASLDSVYSFVIGPQYEKKKAVQTDAEGSRFVTLADLPKKAG